MMMKEIDAIVSLNLVEKGETGLGELREALFAWRVGRASKFWRQFEHLWKERSQDDALCCLEQGQHDYEMGFNLSNLSPIHVQLLICHDISLKQCKFVDAHDDE